MTTKYFHELSLTEYEATKNLFVAEVMHQYKQPDWCEYPGALEGVMGCWSLVGGMVKDEEFCRSCEMHCSTQCQINK
jgi:hypothetical protein